MYLGCTSWDDSGEMGIFTRIVVAIFSSYFAVVASGTAFFPMAAIFLYPVEVKLLLLEGMKRFDITIVVHIHALRIICMLN